jgi:hypothetical protein
VNIRLGAGGTATAETAGKERADDGLRTRDLQLGKLALYQLSYVRVERILPCRA